MLTEVSAFVPGGNSARRRPRKPFALGAPQPLVAPLEGLLDTVCVLAGADRAAAFAMEGRDVTLVAARGDGPPLWSRLAARALAHGLVLTEQADGRYVQAIPMADSPHPGSERRRFKPRRTLTSACLVIEGPGSLPGRGFDEPVAAALTRAILAAVEARAFADAVATDRSTGALNRAAFERAAAEVLALCGDAGRPAALLLLEVVGRRPGLEVDAAEEAMLLAAAAVRQALRTSDLVGRRGPDEICALLVDADPAHLPATIDRVLARVASAIEPLLLDRPVIGAASLGEHAATLAEIDAAALDALEGARSAGPGSFKVHDPALGRSPTACRRSFFTGDPGLDARKAALLFEGIMAAHAASEPRAALDAILRALLAATGADRAAVLSGSGASLELSAARDHDWAVVDPPFRFSRSTCLRALALGRAIYVPDAASGQVGSSAFELKLRSVVAVPLLGRDGPLGVLYADSLRPAPRSFAAEELAYLEALAAQAALAIENATLRERLEEENLALRRAARQGADTSVLVGSSPAWREALKHLPDAVAGSSPILLRGEPGTGKKLLARKIHEVGSRAEGSFVAQDCAAIPRELLESELFGHAAGAFAGAVRAKRGLIEIAHGGTLLLDHVADLPLALQAKILRVLDEREVRRIGETRGQKVDFRLICATARDLAAEVDAGRFSRALHDRIGAFTFCLPPLRERRADIAELAGHFARRTAERLGRPRPSFAAAAIHALEQNPWPGNVRELAHAIEKAVAMARGGTIETAHLGLEPGAAAGPGGPLRAVLGGVERDLVAAALSTHGGNVSAAARTLGIARQQVQRLMRKYRLKA